MFKACKTLFLLIFSCVALSAQVSLEDGQFEGTIITKKGEEKGIIWLNGNDMSPWRLQKTVLFLPEKKFLKAKKLKRNDFDKYKPKDILGYRFADRVFLTRKYSEAASIGVNLLPSRHFLEALVEGEMMVFRYYTTPESVGMAEVIDKEREEARNNPLTLLELDEEDLQPVHMVNFYELLEDCDFVYDKYDTGGYGFMPKPEEKKNKGLKGLINRSLETANAEFVLDMAKDYNSECGADQ
ncbi:MAG: hypothetical protein R2824_23115 [Saprospiraceae bacterium]|nr:hypothetical protein [Lewinella sp.]